MPKTLGQPGVPTALLQAYSRQPLLPELLLLLLLLQVAAAAAAGSHRVPGRQHQLLLLQVCPADQGPAAAVPSCHWCCCHLRWLLLLLMLLVLVPRLCWLLLLPRAP
jgi:hypothetical protein